MQQGFLWIPGIEFSDQVSLAFCGRMPICSSQMRTTTSKQEAILKLRRAVFALDTFLNATLEGVRLKETTILANHQ